MTAPALAEPWFVITLRDGATIIDLPVIPDRITSADGVTLFGWGSFALAVIPTADLVSAVVTKAGMEGSLP